MFFALSRFLMPKSGQARVLTPEQQDHVFDVVIPPEIKGAQK